MQVSTDPQGYEWILTHLQVIGWPALCIAAWKFIRFISKLEQRLLMGEERITHMATNDMPAIRGLLRDLNIGINGMRRDFQVWNNATGD